MVVFNQNAKINGYFVIPTGNPKIENFSVVQIPAE
jgi:hypothetical protein